MSTSVENININALFESVAELQCCKLGAQQWYSNVEKVITCPQTVCTQRQK